MNLADLGAPAGGLLKERGQTIAVAESSAGGVIAAALLAVPGASAYFKGGGVVYTGDAKADTDGGSGRGNGRSAGGHRNARLHLARAARQRLGADWGIGETGAAGPAGNRYGDPPGHTCIAVSGSGGMEKAITLATGSDRREENMWAFACAALDLLAECLTRE